MLLESGDTITIDKSSVKDIIVSKDDLVFFGNGKYHKTSGPFYALRYDFDITTIEFNSSILSFVAGLRLNKKWHVGIGYGHSANSARVPGNSIVYQKFQHVFAYGRYNIFFNKKILFVDNDIGYGFNIADDFSIRDLENGIYAKPSIGIEFGSTNRVKWHIKISQFMQSSGGRIESNDRSGNRLSLNYKQFYNRTMIGIGFTW